MGLIEQLRGDIYRFTYNAFITITPDHIYAKYVNFSSLPGESLRSFVDQLNRDTNSQGCRVTIRHNLVGKTIKFDPNDDDSNLMNGIVVAVKLLLIDGTIKISGLYYKRS